MKKKILWLGMFLSLLSAVSCGSEEKEREITNLLLENNVNYKRSNDDIEILYTNAKQEVNKVC